MEPVSSKLSVEGAAPGLISVVVICLPKTRTARISREDTLRNQVKVKLSGDIEENRSIEI